MRYWLCPSLTKRPSLWRRASKPLLRPSCPFPQGKVANSHATRQRRPSYGGASAGESRAEYRPSRSAHLSYSPNRVEEAFSEVRHTLATPSNSKYTPYGRCARTHNLGRVPPKCGQRPRTASRGRWAPVRGLGSQWCTRLPSLSPYRDKGRKGLSDPCAFFASYLTRQPRYTKGRIRQERKDS